MTTVKTKTAKKPSTRSAAKTSTTKQAKIINLLQRQKGATIAELMRITRWQEHSMRGFISGTLKKRMGFDIISEKSSKGTRRYRIGTSEPETSAASLTSIDTGGQA